MSLSTSGIVMICIPIHCTLPLALWYSQVTTGVTDIVGDITLYGIDPDGLISDIETENVVVVSESTVHLFEDQVSEINRLVPDPLTDDSNHGIHHYLSVHNYFRTQY